MVRIKRKTLEAIIEAARNTYPEEFIALLGSRGSGAIDEFILLPSVYGTTFSSIRLDLLPYTANAKGSVHSHPGPYARPSKQDLAAFKAMGEIHLIIAYPFSFENSKAFDAEGKQLEIELVE